MYQFPHFAALHVEGRKKKTANTQFPEALIYDVATVQAPWESLGFHESFHNVIALILCSSLFTSNSLFLLFAAFCRHHHFSELPQHQRFTTLQGCRCSHPQVRSLHLQPSAFPLKSPSLPIERAAANMGWHQDTAKGSNLSSIASQPGNHIYPEKGDFHHGQNAQEQDQRRQRFLPLLATELLQTHSSGTKFYFQLKFSPAPLCRPGASKMIYTLFPLGEKKPKANHTFYK